MLVGAAEIPLDTPADHTLGKQPFLWLRVPVDRPSQAHLPLEVNNHPFDWGTASAGLIDVPTDRLLERSGCCLVAERDTPFGQQVSRRGVAARLELLRIGLHREMGW